MVYVFPWSVYVSSYTLSPSIIASGLNSKTKKIRLAAEDPFNFFDDVEIAMNLDVVIAAVDWVVVLIEKELVVLEHIINQQVRHIEDKQDRSAVHFEINKTLFRTPRRHLNNGAIAIITVFILVRELEERQFHFVIAIALNDLECFWNRDRWCTGLRFGSRFLLGRGLLVSSKDFVVLITVIIEFCG